MRIKSTNYPHNLKREIRFTEDGSTTLHVPELNESYHSIHGAIQESMHVFIHSGLCQVGEKEEIYIFEMGFGTGLNCFLSGIHSGTTKIHYLALEKFPIEENLVRKLNYSSKLSHRKEDVDFFNTIHYNPWNNNDLEVNEQFVLQKCKEDIIFFDTDKRFDIIYFDAFAPQFQPELWTVPVFQKMFNFLKENGILVTYCAKGEVRRNMIKSGFKVERIPGPPGKREMLRAYKGEKE